MLFHFVPVFKGIGPGYPFRIYMNLQCFRLPSILSKHIVSCVALVGAHNWGMSIPGATRTVH